MVTSITVLDSTGATQTVATNDAIVATQPTLVATGVGNASKGLIVDPTSGNAAAVIAFHNADNQTLSGTQYGLNTGGVAQLLNQSGNIDRQRETGIDGVSAVGISSGASQLAMSFTTSDSTDNFTAGTRTFTPAAMSGTINGVAWSITVGSVLSLDTAANQEYVVVTAVAVTTFTCVTTKTHNGTVTAFPVVGFVYNQQRDAAGELDGASGKGTTVAAEYEYNGGALAGTASYDRARNIQGKGVTNTTLNGAATAGNFSFVVTAATGLTPGQWIFLTGGTPEVVQVAVNYTIGSTTVPITTALATTHSTGTPALWSIFAINGPGASSFLPDGEGAEAMIIVDPAGTAPNNYSLVRAATADAMAGANIPAAHATFYNGATLDRKKKPNTVGRLVSAAGSTNGTSLKASAADMFGVMGYNAAATIRYLKIYNKASAPTVGTDTPFMTIPLAPTSAFNFTWPTPIYLSTGLAFALTNLAADADTTALTAADIVGLNITYQ